MRVSFATLRRYGPEKIRRRLWQVDLGCPQPTLPKREHSADRGTHYFSTHGCKLGFEVGSFSFPDFFLLGARV
jgi:hypothetical protein